MELVFAINERTNIAILFWCHLSNSYHPEIHSPQRNDDSKERQLSNLNPPPPPPPPKTKRLDKEGKKRGRGVPLRFSPSKSPTMSHLDIDECSTKSGGPSWESRIPWLRNKQNNPSFESNQNVYYGDVMTMYSPHNVPPLVHNRSTTKSTSSLSRTTSRAKHPDGLWSKVSNISKSGSTRGEDVTIESFNEEEWTPQDSAYGAACPMCGCLPKHIRRGIEVTLIGILIFVLVYLIVTTSIRINNEHASSSSGGKSSKTLRDDDYFVENGSHGGNDAVAASSGDDGNGNDDSENSNDDQGGRLLLRGARFLIQHVLS